MRDEFGTLFTDEQFADLFPPQRHPVDRRGAQTTPVNQGAEGTPARRLPLRSCLRRPGEASPPYPHARQPATQEQGERTRFGNSHDRDRENAEDAVCLVVRPGGEVETVHAASTAVVAERQRPETVYHERL